MTRYRLYLVILIYFLCSKINAQEYWVPTNGPFGGQINSVAEISENMLVAGTENGVFITTDTGQNWNRAGLYDFRIHSVAANTTGHIFAGVSSTGGVYLTTNNGTDWSQVGLQDEGVWCIYIDTANNILVGLGNYSPDSGGLYRSTDNGNSWTFLGFLNISVRALAVNSGGDIFAATLSGLYRSTDNGNSWTQVMTDIWVKSIQIKSDGKIFICNRNDYISRSTDNGETWDQFEQGLLSYYVHFLDIYLDDTIYASTEHHNIFSGYSGVQILRSTNNGEYWEKMNDDDLETTAYSFLINSDGKTFLGTDNDGLFSSNDFGINWMPRNSGLSSISVASLETSNDGKLFAGTVGSCLFISLDIGEIWERHFLPDYVRTISDLIYSSENKLFAASYQGVYRSLDDGMSWNYKGLANSSVSYFLFNGDEDLFAATLSEGIYISTNYGDSWYDINNGLTTDNIGSLAITSNQYLFAGTNVGVFRSTNNGLNWVKKSNGLNNNPAFNVLATTNDEIYTGTPFGTIYRSTDYGESWVNKSSGIPASTFTNCFLEIVNGGIWVGTDNGIFHSSNNGDSWIQMNEGLTSLDIQSMVFDSENYLYIGAGQGVFRSINKITNVDNPYIIFPKNYLLLQNYPNPFNPSTIIEYQIPKLTNVKLIVYDVLGNEVATLVNEEKSIGSYEVEFNATALPSGVYFYRIQTGDFVETKKMVLMK